MLCGDMGDKSGQGNPVKMMQINSSELIDKESSNGSNNTKAKGDAPRVFSKKPVVVKAERVEYDPIAQPLYHTRICSKQTFHSHVNSSSKRSTVAHAGSARYIPQAVPVNSLPKRSLVTHGGFARDIPKRVLVNSLPTKSIVTYTGSARDIPQGVPINPLPTRLGVRHSGSARDIPEGIPINPLPRRSTVTHADYGSDIPQAVPIKPIPTRSRVTQAGSARDIPLGFPINPLPTRLTVTHPGYASDIPQGFPVPVSSIKDVRVVSELKQRRSYKNMGIGSGSIGSYHSLDAMEVNPSIYVLNSSNGKAPVTLSSVTQSDQREAFDGETFHVQMAKKASQLRSHGEGESLNMLMSNKSQIPAKKHASTTPKSNGEVSNVSKPPTVTVAVPGSRSRQGVLSKNRIASRVRRERINKRLEALRELLPHSEEGNQQARMDGVIDYVKYLQLQIKTLSQSTLGGEAIDDPFINLEGFGHYLLDQEMLSPLEEVIGRLMEVDNTSFTQLLESRGLSVMPMALTGGLFQAM